MTNVLAFAIIIRMRKRVIALISAAALCLPLTGCGAVSSRTVHDDGEALALLTVYATAERGKVSPLLVALGHAYASVENVSDAPIVLGKGYVLPPKETVTLACWEFDAHAGLWYNIEPIYIEQGWFTERKSVTRSLDEDSLERVNTFLKNESNDVWTLFQNCTHFTVNIWNEAASGTEDIIDTDGMLTPSQLEEKIVAFNGYEVARPHTSELATGYFDGDGFIEFKLEEEQ